MTTHTPGPWTLEGYPLTEPSNVRITSKHGTICNIYDCSTEDEANARLIAAAPEMLAVLETLSGDGFDSFQTAMHSIFDVIHKATGA